MSNLSLLLARLASVVPYRIKRAADRPLVRSLYLRGLRFSGGTYTVKTSYCTFKWKATELTKQGYLLGTYEPEMQAAFARYVKPGMVAYDIGAHAGFHTLNLGALVGERGKVIAFEPYPPNRLCVEAQMKVNPLLNALTLPYALSDYCGMGYVDIPEGATASALCLISESGTPAEFRTIDALVASGEIPPPDIIKIDVEGFEVQALTGGLNTLRAHHPIILCDYSSPLTESQLVDVLTPLGYRIEGELPYIATYQIER